MRTQAPQGLIAKITLGRGPRGLTSYLTGKGEAARVLMSTFASGHDARGWAVEVRACQQLAPRTRRSVVHMSLSAPVGVQVSDEQFQIAARQYLDAMELDADAHPWALVVHQDTAHPHCHLIVAAVNPVTRRAWRDSQSYARNVQAAARAARAAGIVPPPPREGPPPPSSSAIKAGRRESRRATRQRQDGAAEVTVMTPADMAEALRSAVEAAQGHDAERLLSEAQTRGIEVELVRASTGRISGLKARQIGGESWAKGSDLGRDLSWPQIQKRLSTTTASEGAAMSQSQPSADSADPLAFLSQPIQTSAAAPAADRDARRYEREQEASEEIDDEMRKLSARQLVHLRSEDEATKLDRALVAAELLARLMVMAVRFLTLGAVQLRNPLEAERQARGLLARRASDELERRRRDNTDLAARSRAVKEHVAALNHRRLHVQARRTAAALAYGMPNNRGSRMVSEAAFDSDRAKHGLATISDARAHLVQLEGSLASLFANAPRGIDRLRMSMVAAHRQQVARAKSARERAANALRALMDSLESAQRGHVVAVADELAQAKARDERELEALANEERRVEGEVREQARDAERVRIGQVMRPPDDDLSRDGDERRRDAPRPRG